MANAIHKTTLHAIRSISPNALDPIGDWLINPSSFALVDTVPMQYRKLNGAGDDIEEMSEAEKDAVEAAGAVETVDGILIEGLDLVNGLIRAQRIRENNLRGQINAVANAVKSNAIKPVGMPGDLSDVPPSANRSFIRSKIEDIQSGTAE